MRTPYLRALTVYCMLILGREVEVVGQIESRNHTDSLPHLHLAYDRERRDPSQFQQYWGTLTPYNVSVPVADTSGIPQNCEIVTVQVLARHGARFPYQSELVKQQGILRRIKRTTNWSRVLPEYDFRDFELENLTDDLTTLGRKEMVLMGREVYDRYGVTIARRVSWDICGDILVRTTDHPRLLKAAQLFIEGYCYPYHTPLRLERWRHKTDAIKVIAEGTVTKTSRSPKKNPLRHAMCDAFEDTVHAKEILRPGRVEQDAFIRAQLAPSVVDRVNRLLYGADLSTSEVFDFMKICPYAVASNPKNARLPICTIFNNSDWMNFGYAETIHKWYRNGPGHYLGPTQGVPWAKELMVRLNNDPGYLMGDRTAVDVARDMDSKEFPLPPATNLFVDFVHGSDMVSMLSAIGVYPQHLTGIPLDKYHNETNTYNFSATWTVPFAARTYIERLSCKEARSDAPNRWKYSGRGYVKYARVIVNNRIMNLAGDKTDKWGRIYLEDFNKIVDWAASGDGNWRDCKGTATGSIAHAEVSTMISSTRKSTVTNSWRLQSGQPNTEGPGPTKRKKVQLNSELWGSTKRRKGRPRRTTIHPTMSVMQAKFSGMRRPTLSFVPPTSIIAASTNIPKKTSGLGSIPLPIDTDADLIPPITHSVSSASAAKTNEPHLSTTRFGMAQTSEPSIVTIRFGMGAG